MKQDPPSFSITPERQYKEEAGRSLLIPCQGKIADPTIKVTWSKVNPLNQTFQCYHSAAFNSRKMFLSHTAQVPLSWDTRVHSAVNKVEKTLNIFNFILQESLQIKCRLSICLFSIESNASIFSCGRLCQDVIVKENEVNFHIYKCQRKAVCRNDFN